MIKKQTIFFLAVLLFGNDLLSGQPQIFEHTQNGFIPFLGFRRSQNTNEGSGGAEYNVEGKFCLGATYSRFLEDTVFQKSPNVKTQTVSPYLVMELIEPDKRFPMSFSLRAGYAYTSGEHYSPGVIQQNFNRHDIYGGPEVGMRFFAGGSAVIIPILGYQFHYVMDQRSFWANGAIDPVLALQNNRSNPRSMWHDIIFKIPLSFMITDVIGMIFNPKISARIGGLEPVEFFGSISLGAVIRFD